MAKQKLYCYVDETGQDTRGSLFIVSVVVSGDEREKLIEVLEKIEKHTGKGKIKWMFSKHKSRLAYIKSVLENPIFKEKFHYTLYKNSKEYLALTVLTVARAVTAVAQKDYLASVFVDGLPKSRIGWFGTELRHLHIHTKKIRGVRREEADALMRLADALCGFTRAAILGSKELKALLDRAKIQGYIKEV